MINLVTGGAGFLGSHLIDQLIKKKEKVVCIDNLSTGNINNISHHLDNDNFKFIEHDIIHPIEISCNRIWHLACPASPIHYQFNPIKTAKTSFLGTYNMLGMAKRVGAKFLLASTSEIYGDPEIHPQPETYRGNVNPIGVRSCYDEGKRIAETLTFDYKRSHDIEIKVARIFNTYGPRMLPNDGRVVSNLIIQGLSSESMSLYGDGLQTRSFCYVDDLIEGLIKLMDSQESGPINLGNPNETTILDLARLISKKLNIKEKFIFKELPQDDPLQRKPIIKKAQEKLNWDTKIDLNSGIDKTIKYFKNINN